MMPSLSSSSSASSSAKGAQDNTLKTNFGGDFNFGAGSGSGLSPMMIAGLAAVALVALFLWTRRKR